MSDQVKSELESADIIADPDDVAYPKLSKSCDACKLRKVRCSGDKPKCSNCILKNKSCTYSHMKKPGLKSGYGKSLSDKISRVEESHLEMLELLKVITARLDSLENERTGGGRMLKRQKLVLANGDSPVSSASQLDSPNISLVFPPLPHSNHNSDHQDHHQDHLPIHHPPSTSTTSHSSRQSHQLLLLPSLLNPFVTGNELKFNNSDLPSKQIMQVLVNLYFQYINPIFPLLHPVTLRQQIFESSESTYILYGVALVSLKYLSDESYLSARQKIQFYKTWKLKIMQSCFDVSNLDKLTTMLLLALESMGQSNDPETWSLIAVVCSGVTHLDLAEEVNGPAAADTPGSVHSNSSLNPAKLISTRSLKLLKKPQNFVEEEQRRRLFWCIYILDRINGVLSSTPLHLSEHEITCLLPMNTARWLDSVKSPKLDSFGYSIQLVRIFGRTHEFNRMKVDINSEHDCSVWYLAFMRIENDLKDFVDSLPMQYSTLLINNDLSSFESPSCYDLLLHTLYNIILIKLHSPLGYPHHESEFFKRSHNSRRICANCCSNVLRMVTKIGNLHVLFKLGPCYSIYLWIVTRVIIVEQILDQTNYELVIDQNELLKLKLEKLLNVLDSIGESWMIAKKYSKMIRFLSGSRIKLNNKVLKAEHLQLEPDQGLDLDEHTARLDESDSDELVSKRDPSSIISDMTLNTYFVSLMLTNQIEKKEKELAKDIDNYEFSGLDANASKFQLDLNSYGFEDFFKYLGDIDGI